MIVKIKYQDPQNLQNFIVVEVDDEQVNIPQYCENLHKTVLCNNSANCNGENCKIWIESHGQFVLAGVPDF